MLRPWLDVDRLAGFVYSLWWAYRSCTIFSFFEHCDSIWVRFWRRLGGPRRCDARQIWRKRGLDFSDVELRRDFYFAVHGLRSIESPGESSRNAASSANYLVTLHSARNPSACWNSDCARRRWFGMDAAAKNASGIRADRDGAKSIGSAICGHRCVTAIRSCRFLARRVGRSRWNGGSAWRAAQAYGWHQRGHGLRRDYCRPSGAVESFSGNSHCTLVRRDVGGRGCDAAPGEYSLVDHIYS